MNKTLVCIFIILLMTIIIMSLPLSHPSFGLLDDVYSLTCFERIDKAKSLKEFWNIICPKEIGRLRPVYFIYNYLIYKIVGKSPLGFYIFHTLNLFIVFLWLFFITRLICNDNLLALIAPLLLFSSNTLLENYYTLGKAENQLLFFGLTIIYLFFLNNKWLTEKKFSDVPKIRFKFINILLILSTFAFYGSKETAISYLPLAILWLCLVIFRRPNEFKWQTIIYSASFVVLNLITLVIFILLKPKQMEYAAKYSFDIVNIKLILTKYYNMILIDLYYFWVCLFYWIIGFLLNVVFRKKQSSRLIYQVFFLLYFCIFLFIYLPWPGAMPKYIVVSIIGSVIFSLSILADIRDHIKQLHRNQAFAKILLLRTLFFSILALMFLNLFYGVRDSYSEGKVRNLWDRVNAGMMKYVAENSSPNSRVFLFCDDIESTYSISNFPKVLYDRNDIKFTDWALKVNPDHWANKETCDKIVQDLNNMQENDLVCVTRLEENINEYQRLPLNNKASYIFHQTIKNLFRGHLKPVHSDKLSTSYYPIRIYNGDKVERKPFSIINKKFSYAWGIYKVDKIYQIHNDTRFQYDLRKTPQRFFCELRFFNFHSPDVKHLKFFLNTFPQFPGDFSGKFLNIFINEKYVCSHKIQPDIRIYMIEVPQELMCNKINDIDIVLSEKINTSLTDSEQEDAEKYFEDIIIAPEIVYLSQPNNQSR